MTAALRVLVFLALANAVHCQGRSYSVRSSHAPVCGNSRREGGEACDDGNTANGDGCTSSCTVEAFYSCAGGSSTQPDFCAGLFFEIVASDVAVIPLNPLLNGPSSITPTEDSLFSLGILFMSHNGGSLASPISVNWTGPPVQVYARFAVRHGTLSLSSGHLRCTQITVDYQPSVSAAKSIALIGEIRNLNCYIRSLQYLSPPFFDSARIDVIFGSPEVLSVEASPDSDRTIVRTTTIAVTVDSLNTPGTLSLGASTDVSQAALWGPYYVLEGGTLTIDNSNFTDPDVFQQHLNFSISHTCSGSLLTSLTCAGTFASASGTGSAGNVSASTLSAFSITFRVSGSVVSSAIALTGNYTVAVVAGGAVVETGDVRFVVSNSTGATVFPLTGILGAASGVVQGFDWAVATPIGAGGTFNNATNTLTISASNAVAFYPHFQITARSSMGVVDIPFAAANALTYDPSSTPSFKNVTVPSHLVNSVLRRVTLSLAGLDFNTQAPSPPLFLNISLTDVGVTRPNVVARGVSVVVVAVNDAPTLSVVAPANATEDVNFPLPPFNLLDIDADEVITSTAASWLSSPSFAGVVNRMTTTISATLGTIAMNVTARMNVTSVQPPQPVVRGGVVRFTSINFTAPLNETALTLRGLVYKGFPFFNMFYNPPPSEGGVDWCAVASATAILSGAVNATPSVISVTVS